MQLKNDILVRTYLVFIGMAVFCIVILGRAVYIQVGEGKYWRSMADSAHLRFEEIEAERGSIISEDGLVLSTSVPEFDIYMDYMADGLRDRDGLLFRTYVDSLADGLAKLFKDKKAAEYKKELKQGYRSKSRYDLLKRKISFNDYESLKQLPLIKLGRNKSGMISVVRMKRLYPFRTLANRTIGIARDSNKVGLERKYDQFLSGVTGKRLVRYIAGGAGVPVEGSDEEPQDGCDIVTTIDVGIQDAAQQALRKIMERNEAERGTCIVMEVKTGKIKAIANLGRQSDGSYWENYNYALSSTEPGSTWKLVTLLAVLEDKLININSGVNLEGGTWRVGGETVFDSEHHGLYQTTVKHAFEHSSNVGMAKLAYNYYYNQPAKFINHISKLGMDSATGIDLPGEAKPSVHKPGSRFWSNAAIPWMGFGYHIAITPMHTAMLYNAVANGGKMMKPYLVNAVVKDGQVVKAFEPVVLKDRICSDNTLKQLRECLDGVVLNGTGKSLKTDAYSIAGKTGTSLIADKGITYADHMYQSSFAGYFPANDPQYTIVVVIRNKPHAALYYGAAIAGPVFREVADRIFSTKLRKPSPARVSEVDSSRYVYSGKAASLKKILKSLQMKSTDSSMGNEMARVYASNYKPVVKGVKTGREAMPELSGFGLKDALDACEERGLKITVKGKGKVSTQSIAAGSPVKQGQTIHLELN